MDVELEQVEEGVADHGDGAVLLALDAVVEFERGVGLVADWEGDPLDLVGFGILDMFTCFSVGKQLSAGRYVSSMRKVLRGRECVSLYVKRKLTSCGSCILHGWEHRSDRRGAHFREHRLAPAPPDK